MREVTEKVARCNVKFLIKRSNFLRPRSITRRFSEDAAGVEFLLYKSHTSHANLLSVNMQRV